MSKLLRHVFSLLLILQFSYATITTKLDSISSGVPFRIKGKIVLLDTLIPPRLLFFKPKIIATKTSVSYPVHIKIFPFPEPSRVIVMGENGVPFPTTEIAKPIKKRMNLSPS